MKFLQPKFWHQKNNIFSFLLAPIALIVIFLTYIKKIFSKEKKFEIPIICVGNIYIGGTGKTPISILLSEELSNLKRKPKNTSINNIRILKANTPAFYIFSRNGDRSDSTHLHFEFDLTRLHFYIYFAQQRPLTCNTPFILDLPLRK